MVAIIKTATPTVQQLGPISATETPARNPVRMAVVPTAWTSASRTVWPTNGPRYNDYEMEIIAESDQTLWDGIAEGYLRQERSYRVMSPDDVVRERAKLRAWHATYKSWASI